MKVPNGWLILLTGWLVCACQPKPEPEAVLTVDGWRSLADEGDPEAQNRVGMMYLQGTELPRDLERAMTWLERAAAAEHAGALYNLGVLHQEGRFVSQDFERAYDYFLKAGRRGLAEAQMSLGYLFESGLGTRQDLAEAVYWYRRAATFGKTAKRERSYYSQNLLSHRDAQYLYGNRDAQFMLGRLFEEGSQEMRPDFDMAVEWYEDAAVRGDGAAARRLAILVGLRKGYREDTVMGYAWAKVALVIEGSDSGAQIASSIEQLLTSNQRRQGDVESERLLKLIEYNQANL